jgi:catechol 2,3-dioxygenase-like lactoylglutathione lyase family enzyme
MLVRVWVTDLDRSERFYRAVFGFSAAQSFGPDNRMFGAPSATMPSIVLARVAQPRSNGSFALAVNDAAAVMKAAVAAGGDQQGEASSQAHGMPIAFVTDPDGALIEVIQLPESR